MKRFFFLLTFIILTVFCHTNYTEAAPYKYSAYDLGISTRHNIEECRIQEILGDEVFFWTVKEGDSFLFKKVEFFTLNINSGKETKIPYTLTDIFISDAWYSGKYLYVLYHDKDDRQCIRQVDLRGNVRNDFLLQNTDMGQSYYRIYSTDDNRLFATGNVGVAEFDMTGKRVWHVTFSTEVSHSQYGGGDKFYSVRGKNIYLMDLNTKKLTGSRITNDYSFADLYAYNGNLYIFTQSGISRWNADAETAASIVNFSDYGITSENYAISVDDEKVRFIDYDPFDKNTKVILHTLSFNEQGQGIKKLEFAIPDYIPSRGGVYELVDEFNRNHAEIDVVVSNYAYRDELDTMPGTPDVVFMTDTKLIKNMSRLCDMKPYMETSELLKPTDFIPAAQRNYTSGDSVYMAPLELHLYSFVFRNSDYAKTTLSANDFLNYLTADGTLYTDYELSKENILSAVMEDGIYEFVDFDKGTCSFDSQDFKNLLIKIDGLESDNVFYPDVEYAHPDDGDRILDESQIGTFDFFAKKRAVYGEDVKAVVIPTDDADEKFLMTALCLAITTDSKYPEEAFEFVQYFAYVYNSDIEGAIPAKSFNYDATAAALKQCLLISDFFGVATDIKAADIDEVTKALNNSVARKPRAAAILDYVNHYANMYFNGEASLDVVTEDLQATVTRYLSK